MGWRRDMAGMSYPEVMVAVLLLSLSLLPAMDAMQGGIQGSRLQQELLIDQYAMRAKLESVLARPFGELQVAADAAASPSVATSFSDIYVTSDGRALTRRVFIAGYDADNADGDNNVYTGADDDILWIRVELADTAMALETLSSL